MRSQPVERAGNLGPSGRRIQMNFSLKPSGSRVVLDEDGGMFFTAWEENPGTVFKALCCEWGDELRQALEYPDSWPKMTDGELYRFFKNLKPQK